jgi:uncharacterized protein (DUF1501 family)
MNRRKFITHTGITGSALLTAPSLFSSTLRTDLKNKKAVLVILSGGVRRNDFMEIWKRKETSGAFSNYHLYTGMQHSGSAMSHHSGHAAIYRSLLKDSSAPATALFPESGFIPAIKKTLHTTVRTRKNERFLSASGSALSIYHLEGFDAAHHNMQGYQRLLEASVQHCGKLWNEAQSSEQTKDNTLLIVTTDIGRNAFTNSMNGLDHHDESARDIFCLVSGPASAVKGKEQDNSSCGQEVIGEWVKKHFS